MAKYKVGDIFINHNDNKILQVCAGLDCKKCCYSCSGKIHPFQNISCISLIDFLCHVKELPSLPPGTKVKIREDLKEGAKYGRFTFVSCMGQNKEVTIKNYSAYYKAYEIAENNLSYSFEMFDQVINEPKEKQ